MRHSVCPWQGGSLLRSSARKIIHNPKKLLREYIESEMVVADIGCGMGYFTIPMAGLLNGRGTVVAVDLQEQMLSGLTGVSGYDTIKNSIHLHQCSPDRLLLEPWQGKIDFVLLFMMLHETPRQAGLISELHQALKPGGRCLFAEPIIHVKGKDFERELLLFKQGGFKVISCPKIAICRAVLLEKAV